eukprot:TRINITY_DN3030_c0_g3_i1.p1 TRINITY_DN3030_c0_g3~~TRINITY_DN3030_c0_g3_i1.p1  ORF type:complete len:1489 (-),score=311.83 TRINITY_DN3030_c0_g3_i1:20-4402(-)
MSQNEREKLLDEGQKTSRHSRHEEAYDFASKLKTLPAFIMDQSTINQISWEEFVRYVVLDCAAIIVYIPFFIIFTNFSIFLSGKALPVLVAAITWVACVLIWSLTVSAVEILLELARPVGGDADALYFHQRRLALFIGASIAALAAVYAWQPEQFSPLVWLNIVVLVILPCMSALVVFTERHPFYRSRLLSSVWGKKILVIDDPFELYLLLKSIKQQPTRNMISFVRESDEAPARKLRVSNTEVEPFRYTLYRLSKLHNHDVLDEADDYKKFLSKARFTKAGRFEDEDISKFIGEEAGTRTGWAAWLTGISRRWIIRQHWLSKTLESLLWRLILLAGPVLYFKEIWRLFQGHCHGTPDHIEIDGHTICHGKDCGELCALLPKFVDAVQTKLQVSPAEFALPLMMVVVDVIVGTFQKMEADRLFLEKEYLNSLSIHKALVDDVVHYKECLEKLLYPMKVLNEAFRALAVWKFGARNPDYELDAEIIPENYAMKSARPPPNNVLSSVAKSMTGDRDGYTEIPVEILPQNYAHGMQSVWAALTDAKHEFQTATQENIWNTNCRVCTDVLVKTKDWPKLVEELLGPRGKYRACAEQLYERGGRGWMQEPMFLGPYVNPVEAHEVKQPRFVVPGGFTLSHVSCATFSDQLLTCNLAAQKNRPATVNDLMRILLGESDGASGSTNFEQLFGEEVEADQIWVFIVRFSMSNASLGNSDHRFPIQGNLTLSQAAGFLREAAATKPAGGYTLVTFYLGISSQRAFRDIAFKAIRAWSFMIGAVLFPLVAPLMRMFVQGGSFFPSAVRLPLVLSTVIQFLVLASFLAAFTVSTRKLAYVYQMLKDLDDFTVAPAAPDSEGNPFDLVITEPAGMTYDPTWDYWKQEWDTKRANLDNWRRTAEYLQVFLGTVRLSAQGLLIASGLMVVDLLVVSLVQAWQGKGALSIDHSKVLKTAQRMAKKGIKEGVKMGQRMKEQVKDAVQSATNLVSSKAVHEASRRLTAGPGESLALYAASEQLHSALRPARHALQHAVGLQLGALSQALESSLQQEGRRLSMHHELTKGGTEMLKSVELGDMSKVTKTQVMTIVFVLLVLAYSVPMILKIAQVNDYIARHAYLMSSTKVKHQSNQASREGRAAGDADSPPADDTAAASEANTDSPAAGNTDRGDDPQQGKGKAQNAAIDPGLNRYERTLEANIKSTSKNVFPLTVFGFVINTALIVTWLLLAFSPIFSNLKQMVPPLAAQACQKIEESKLFHDLEHAAESSVDMANQGLAAAENATKGIDAQINKVKSQFNANADAISGSSEDFVDAHSHDAQKMLRGAMADSGITQIAGMDMKGGKVQFDFGKFFDQTVCNPLVAWMKRQSEAAIGNATEKVKGLQIPTSKDRRLLELPVEGPVSEWWAATPGDPEAKLLLVKLQLDDLQHEAQRLLISAPLAVEAALQQHGAVPSLDLALSHYSEAVSHRPELEL